MKIRNKRKLLLIEDDLDLAFVIRKHLEGDEVEVQIASKGSSGLERLTDKSFDAAILDIGLPEMSGIQVVQGLRKFNSTMPVIIITGLSRDEVEKQAYLSGASIFHRKPIDFDLLSAQVFSVLNYNPTVDNEDIIQVGIYGLNNRSKNLEVGDQAIKLSSKEYNLLKLLMATPGKVYTRDQIIRRINNRPKDITPGSVDTLVSRVRSKMDTGEAGEVLETVHGFGYRFNAPTPS